MRLIDYKIGASVGLVVMGSDFPLEGLAILPAFEARESSFKVWVGKSATAKNGKVNIPRKYTMPESFPITGQVLLERSSHEAEWIVKAGQRSRTVQLSKVDQRPPAHLSMLKHYAKHTAYASPFYS